MRYVVDNDLHIHSYLSLCSDDPEQTTERILQYAKENDLKTICLTDHFWDEKIPGASSWYEKQNYAHICKAKPLPKSEDVRFLFGCETDLDRNCTLGISEERLEQMDFVVIPTTHLHMKGFTLAEDEETVEKRAEAWINRLDAVLDMDIPFRKIGIAHLTCSLIYTKKEYIKILNIISDEEMYRLFKKAAKCGVGIEINADCMKFPENETDDNMRVYRIAKECGCKFYMGSDVHNPCYFDRAKALFEKAVDLLGLTEDDKFII